MTIHLKIYKMALISVSGTIQSRFLYPEDSGPDHRICTNILLIFGVCREENRDEEALSRTEKAILHDRAAPV
jgi:hypothetical protein